MRFSEAPGKLSSRCYWRAAAKTESDKYEPLDTLPMALKTFSFWSFYLFNSFFLYLFILGVRCCYCCCVVVCFCCRFILYLFSFVIGGGGFFFLFFRTSILAPLNAHVVHTIFQDRPVAITKINQNSTMPHWVKKILKSIRTSFLLYLCCSHVDFLNVMTYDLHMPSEHRVAHHSSLFSTTKDETGSVVSLHLHS